MNIYKNEDGKILVNHEELQKYIRDMDRQCYIAIAISVVLAIIAVVIFGMVQIKPIL